MIIIIIFIYKYTEYQLFNKQNILKYNLIKLLKIVLNLLI